MKKIELLLFVFLLTFILIRCENEFVPDNQGDVKFMTIENNLEELEGICVKTENNTLNFKTEDDFQKCINFLAKNDSAAFEELSTKLDFVSLHSYYKLSLVKCPVDDQIFASMLNLKNQIIIENFLFTFDFTKRIIEVTSLVRPDEKVQYYSFDDEVFAIIKNENILKSTATDYCGQENMVHSFSGGVFTSVDYNTYGVYFSLVSKIWVEQDFINYIGQRTVDSPFVMQQSGHPVSEYDYNLVVPTGINSRCFFKRTSYQNEIIYDRYVTHDNELTVTPYVNTRRLIGFRLDVQYTWQFDPGGLFGNDQLMIQCHHY
jgi:hypothetical protein